LEVFANIEGLAGGSKSRQGERKSRGNRCMAPKASALLLIERLTSGTRRRCAKEAKKGRKESQKKFKRNGVFDIRHSWVGEKDGVVKRSGRGVRKGGEKRRTQSGVSEVT